jgi:hypothetical protein
MHTFLRRPTTSRRTKCKNQDQLSTFSLSTKANARGTNLSSPSTPVAVGGYPKKSDNYPNTNGVLNTFKYKIRAQRDCDSLRK